MNSIPKGYKLVPVDPTIEMLSAGLKALGGCVGSCGEASPPEHSDILDAFSGMLDAAPAHPQPIYDEPKERELFEAVFPPCDATVWCEEYCEYYSDLYTDEGGQDYQRKWEGWLACAQSRAKSVEDTNRLDFIESEGFSIGAKLFSGGFCGPKGNEWAAFKYGKDFSASGETLRDAIDAAIDMDLIAKSVEVAL